MGGDGYRREVTPFGGWITDSKHRLVPVETAPHIGCFAVSGAHTDIMDSYGTSDTAAADNTYAG